MMEVLALQSRKMYLTKIKMQKLKGTIYDEPIINSYLNKHITSRIDLKNYGSIGNNASSNDEYISNDGRMHILVGDGAEMCYNAFRAECQNVMLAPEPLLFQSAYGVALAACDGTPEDPDRLTPNYLRLSQAERERLAKIKENKDI